MARCQNCVSWQSLVWWCIWRGRIRIFICRMASTIDMAVSWILSIFRWSFGNPNFWRKFWYEKILKWNLTNYAHPNAIRRIRLDWTHFLQIVMNNTSTDYVWCLSSRHELSNSHFDTNSWGVECRARQCVW